MANFNTHLTIGIACSTVASSIFWQYGIIINPFDLFFAWSLGVVGSILPDVDAPQSMPTQIIFTIISSIAAIWVIITFQKSLHVALLALASLLTYFCFRFALQKFLSTFTTHRGIIHSVPMGLLVSMSLTVLLISCQYQKSTAIVLGSCLAGGFLIHLTLDEIYSVDIIGTRIKRSFGSALQIFSIVQPLRYLAMYGLIVYLYYYLLAL